MNDSPLQAARRVLDAAVVQYHGRPVGTVAARPPGPVAAANYGACFVRDFAVSAFVYLADGRPEVVRNFMETVLSLHEQKPDMEAHEIQAGVMPASFRVVRAEDGRESLETDFGDRAIGRVAPVDAMMWWVILLHAYTQSTGDRSLADRQAVQRAIELILRLCLGGSFEVLPTLLVPDASFMVDRRMGVYGHPLEIQALLYAMLHTVGELYRGDAATRRLVQRASRRQQLLRDHVRSQYWLDNARLSQINRFDNEQFGPDTSNPLNIFPESMPSWLERWLPERGGYLAGNLGPGRMDFRFFSLGNLLAVVFGLASDEQAEQIMTLYEARWDDLVGMVPLKLCYPALGHRQWRSLTGCDRKNEPWSYHNGGNWPVLLWAFVAAALVTRRRELAERALAQAERRLHQDDWPEYYDGRSGRMIGRRANRRQTWSAAALVFSHQLLERPELLSMFPGQPTVSVV